MFHKRRKAQATIMILLNTPYVTITLDKEKGYLHQKWIGFSSSRDFRRAIDFSMNTLGEIDFYKIISDVTEQKLVPPSEQEYVKKKVITFLEKNSRFRIAFITREESIVETCVNLYDRSLRGEKVDGVNKFFNSLKDAEEWIIKE